MRDSLCIFAKQINRAEQEREFDISTGISDSRAGINYTGDQASQTEGKFTNFNINYKLNIKLVSSNKSEVIKLYGRKIGRRI